MTTYTYPIALEEKKIRAANLRAAAQELAESVERLETSERNRREAPAAHLLGRLAQQWQRQAARSQQRRAMRFARSVGMKEGQEYRAYLEGQPCWVAIEGPQVSLFWD